MLLSALAMMFACVNLTACGDDDDDTTTSESKGKSDGEKFASAYSAIKESGTYSVVDNVTNYATLYTYAMKYKNSDDNTYKASFLNGATGATDAATDKILDILNTDSDTVDAWKEAISTIISGTTE